MTQAVLLQRILASQAFLGTHMTLPSSMMVISYLSLQNSQGLGECQGQSDVYLPVPES